MAKKKTLQATLLSQQSRLRAKEKAEQAAKLSEQKRKQPKPKNAARNKGNGRAHPPTVPFKSTDKILLIGEGNFSFSRALAVEPPASLTHLAPANVTATSYDSEEACFSKYPDAQGIVKTIRQRGVEVLFGVDATKLHKHPGLKRRRWDRIVWNFPHAGKGITDQDRNILSNQRLILAFLRSAPHCLRQGSIPVIHAPRRCKRQDDSDEEVEEPQEDNISGSDVDMAPASASTDGERGTVLITLRNVPPYTEWDIPRLAKSPPGSIRIGEESNLRYKLLRSFVFHRNIWKGYEHRMTKGERAHGHGKPGEGGEDRTWEYCLQEP